MDVRSFVRVGLTLVAVALGGSAWSQQSAPRVALIVGNARYPEAGTPLPTTTKDARALADELRRSDFDVDLKENVSKEDMQRAIDAFTSKIRSGSGALFYFSGLCVQVARQNYLIPVNAQASSEADVQRDGISLDAILSEMKRHGARVKIVIIDGSRQNPFERNFRPSAAGLAALDLPDGTLAMYSAATGKVIPDGTGENSLFITELIKQLRIPNLTAEEVFNRTRIGVSRATNNERIPWVASSLVEEFSFGPTRPIAPAPSQTAAPSSSTPEPTSSPVSAGYHPGDFFRDCKECGEMVVVPAGTFEMGSGADMEGPIHRVVIAKPFAIGRYEVTFREWDLCVVAGGCKYSPGDQNWGRDDRPVVNLSWLDAKEFVKWLSEKTGQSYRLPSEAEWEYAARAGTSTPYWWGREIGTRQAQCRECGGGGAQTSPVGSFKSNAFGLFDTAGNAAEWVEDCWNDNYRNAPRDGSAWTTGQCQLRGLRGGSFDSQAKYLRSQARFRYDFDVRYLANGFRVVRELQ
jgi:formylglycine-generating enzyme required for sulfatase activity